MRPHALIVDTNVVIAGLLSSEKNSPVSRILDELLTTLTANAVWREPDASWTAPDPGDNHLWALLISQPHGVWVTADQVLLENPPEHHRVISPKACAGQFL